MSQEQPSVSVVMGVFNGEKHLDQTIESILAQEGAEFELIAVVDGAEDGSGPILDQYATRDPRVRVFHRQHEGLTRSLIFGCLQARGTYIARHDVGDVSDPGRLRAQVEALDTDRDLAFVSCWTRLVGPQGEHLYVTRGSGVASAAARILSDHGPRLLSDGPTHHGSVMMRRDRYEEVGGYREDFYYGQDWDLWYRLAEIGKFRMLASCLYEARIVPEGISSLNSGAQRRAGEIQLEAAKLRRSGLSDAPALERARLIRLEGTSRPSRRRRADGYFFIGSCLLTNRDQAAYPYLLRSLALDPFQPLRWFRLGQSLALRVLGSRR